MKKIGLLLLAWMLVSCVTINIYFPAAEAQKVADEIIDDVWQISPEDAAGKQSTGNNEPTDASKSETPVTE